jgi:hypothetical protein
MTTLAKWAWIILLAILFCPYFFVAFGIGAVAAILLAWLKPEWLDKM